MEIADLARKYNLSKGSGTSIGKLRHDLNHWLATIFDFHPFTQKTIYGAKLDGSEKDIFVDTLLLAHAPKTPNTEITVRTDGDNNEKSQMATDEQVCYTNLPFYVVSRSWHDGGNPTLTPVRSVAILVSSAKTLSVRIELDDGRDTEVTLRENGGVIFVNPQRGEVAELVVTLADCETLSALHRFRGSPLKHEPIKEQRCQRLFCRCNQYVNTSMAEFVECASVKDEDLVGKLYDSIWHYSMPQNLSLWDNSHLKECFQFQGKLAMLANQGSVILQPECGWVKENARKIKIAEDTSLLFGWQRAPPREATVKDGPEQRIVGSILPKCVLETSKHTIQSFFEAGGASPAMVQQLFSPRAQEVTAERVGGEDPVTQLCKYLDRPENNELTDVPTRLWNARTSRVAQSAAAGTRYCAVSYVWDQWGAVNGGQPDLNLLASWLLPVADATGIDWFWLDSLCINQKDKADKARELPKMAQYYGGAAFTVALLRDVTERLATPAPIPWQVIDVRAHREANKRLLAQYTQSRWLTRIWTMQEAWLAKKLVLKTAHELVPGDYLELLRTAQSVVADYGAVPMCLEWLNVGPSLVLGACTGNLISPGETPSLLTRPAGSLLQGNNGNGLQARTTTLQRALRLSNRRHAKLPADRLIGLLGMVDQGWKLAAAAFKSPEDGFALAVAERMVGPEIMLCSTSSIQPGYRWLPNLHDPKQKVEFPYTTSLVLGGTMNITLGGVEVEGLEANLTKVDLKQRITAATGEEVWRYNCKLTTASGEYQVTIDSVTTVRDKKRNVLLLRRTDQQGPFISVRGQPEGGKAGKFYHRKQGFLLTLTNDCPLEEREDFRHRIVG